MFTKKVLLLENVLFTEHNSDRTVFVPVPWFRNYFSPYKKICTKPNRSDASHVNFVLIKALKNIIKTHDST